MRYGRFYIRRKTVRQVTREYLASDECRELAARMARSEVKNYLSELAEAAEIAFPSPSGFLQLIHRYVSYGASTNLDREPEDSFDPDADAPFLVVEGKPLDPELDAEVRQGQIVPGGEPGPPRPPSGVVRREDSPLAGFGPREWATPPELQPGHNED